MRRSHHVLSEALSRRRALGLSAGSLLAAGCWPGALRAADTAPGGSFRFVVVNDVHYRDDRCGAWLEKVFRQIKAAPDQPEFCLMAGDYAENGARAEALGHAGHVDGEGRSRRRGCEGLVHGVPEFRAGG